MTNRYFGYTDVDEASADLETRFGQRQWDLEVIPVKKFGATTPFTDWTDVINDAMTVAAQGPSILKLPDGPGYIGASINPPQYGTSGMQPMLITGGGKFRTQLINRASANTPTILIDRPGITLRDFGVWGAAGYPNVGVKNVGGPRCRYEDVLCIANGSSFWLEGTHSIWMVGCWGAHGSSYFYPSGSWAYGATDAFIHCELVSTGFVHALHVIGCNNELLPYQVYCHDDGTGTMIAPSFVQNQFEGSDHGIMLRGATNFTIDVNYMAEGATAGSGNYALDLERCDGGAVRSYLHFFGYDDFRSTARFKDVLNTNVSGSVPRALLQGVTAGLAFRGASLYRVQDESTDRAATFEDCVNSSMSLPRGVFNRKTGRGLFLTSFATPDSFTAFPYVRQGDQLIKTNPAAGGSPGWAASARASMSALVHTGAGASPTTQGDGAGSDATYHGDYLYPDAANYRITLKIGGVTGVATYKVEDLTAVATLEDDVLTTELAHMVANRFGLKWPTGQTYVAGDTWTTTGTPGTWKAQPNIAA